MTIDEFLDRLEGVTPYSGGYKAMCPAHEDHAASLGVTEGENGEILLQCYAGCPTPSVIEAMELEWPDLWPNSRPRKKIGEPTAIYQYVDEEGKPLFQACRYVTEEGKSFKQRHWDEEEQDWVYSLENVRRVLFNLPTVLAAAAAGQTIYLVEGEKDALNLSARGVVATCNPMGAGKWRDEYSLSLVGAGTAVIVVDKDGPGRNHAYKVRDALTKIHIPVTMVEAREGKDATDHLEAGYDVGEFVTVVERVRRGIVTAREMADSAIVHSVSEEGSVQEYTIPEFILSSGRPLTFRPGRPYLLGGYTGDGKTTIGLQVTRSLCSNTFAPRVGVFTNEMSADDLRNRMIEHWGIPLYKIEHPWEMNDTDRYLYSMAIEQMKGWPLEIIYDTALSADTVDKVTRDRDYEVVLIDHIHRFAWGGDRRNFEAEIVALTNLSLDFNIPVFTLAQLRRFQRGKDFASYPKPTLQDFRETETLGQEAAMALAIWRHRLQDTSYDPTGLSELVVLKNRYGPTGSTTLKLNSGRMLFEPGLPTGGHHGSSSTVDSGAAGEGHMAGPGGGEAEDSPY